MAAEAGEVTFSLKGCDSSTGDYYDSVTVENGSLVLVSKTRGHVHGRNTQAATVCTVTGSDGTDSEDREFRLYTVSDRTPQALPPGSLTLVEAREAEADVLIAAPGSFWGTSGWDGGSPGVGPPLPSCAG